MSAQKKKLNINLVVKGDTEDTFSGQLLAWALTYGRYIIIITQIFVLSVFFLRFKLDRDHTDLKESVSQKQALVESVSDIETEIRRVQGRLIHIKDITANQDGLMKVIRFLQENTPSDTTFSTLALSPEKIHFSATAKNLRTFNLLLGKLQQGNKFTDVTLQDILRRSDGRIEFKIEAKINLEEFS